MPSPPADAGARSPRWSRRSLVLGGLAVAATGCTLSDPAVRGPLTTGQGTAASPGTASASSGTDPTAVEVRLAALAEAVETAPGPAPTGSVAVVSLVRASHLERAAALAAPDPTSRPTAGPPPAGPSTGGPSTGGPSTGGPSPSAAGSRADALQRLAAAERRAATGYRRATLDASGLTALLLGSMSVASTRFARALTAADPPRATTPREHRPTAVVPDTEAVSAVVSSLHALVFGYQQALGRLPVGSSAHERAAAGLRDRRALLHRLSDLLVEAGAEVPAAAPAYVPSPRPTDARTARLLIRRMESALLPFCGLWLAAAAGPDDRTLALDTLAASTATAESWGAPLLAWPGYRD